MIFLTKDKIPTNTLHRIPLYYGSIQVDKYVSVGNSLKLESTILIKKQVLKGVDKEDVWNRYKSKVAAIVKSKSQDVVEVIYYKDKKLTASKVTRSYKLKSIALEKHLGFGN